VDKSAYNLLYFVNPVEEKVSSLEIKDHKIKEMVDI
jgi:hypothetical protein